VLILNKNVSVLFNN